MKLTNENIESVIERIQKFFESLDVPHRDKVRISAKITNLNLSSENGWVRQKF